MGKRSLSANAQGIIQAKEAMARKQWTHQVLAKKVGVKTRQSISKFFAGRPVERRIFIEICRQLDLSWQEVATQVPDGRRSQPMHPAANQPVELNALVAEVRACCQNQIETQLDTVPLWDVPKPISLADIYIDVEVWQDIPNRCWFDLADWRRHFQVNRERGYELSPDGTSPERVLAMAVLARQTHLIIGGKPGTGKTTFLQYVATQCNHGKFAADRVPIYIEWRDLVQDANTLSLLDYICQEFRDRGVSGEMVKTLLQAGKLLILLDGWDEVSPSRRFSLFNKLRWFCYRYPKNRYVITCRTGVELYRFGRFTEVELADWTLTQIGDFAQKYFVAVAGANWEKGLAKAAEFRVQLEYPENRTIQDMARTPLLLSFICHVFQSQARFPRQQARLYQEGLDILLQKWDDCKGVERDSAEQPLSLVNRLKLLDQVASVTFIQQQYCFAQSQVEHYIGDYLQTLPNYQEVDPVDLQIQSQGILKAIECHHGVLVERSRRVYSFANWSLQQYLTAREFTTKTNQNPDAIAEFVTHLTEPSWREVFLFTVTRLRHPEQLIQAMKQGVDQLLIPDQRLGQFVNWIDHRSKSSPLSHKSVAVRAFDFALALILDQGLTQTLKSSRLEQPLEPPPLQQLPSCLSLPQKLDAKFTVPEALAFKMKDYLPPTSLPPPLYRALILNATLDYSLKFNLAHNPERLGLLARSLNTLLDPVFQFQSNGERLNSWWFNHRHSWIKRVGFLMGQHDQGEHDWQFSRNQRRSLWDYYDANQLVVDCVTIADDLNTQVQQQIEDELFLYRE
ncbi:MAG: NACHT domain-containing NTPase [Coleofasciculus sp. C1-SOL-03]|uniref:NACHT C-terminal helical domain 2-containing protein n=1 Tax=Coleofasciculus sp. C1-SOL-03 TaxID=3069522 RepID=UPI0032F4D7DC